MKIARFARPGTSGQVKVGFVDLKENQVFDAATVLVRMGIRDLLDRAVDIVAYNVDKSGALSQGLGDLSSYDAPRWLLQDIRLLAPIESGSLKDFIAFEQHITSVRSRRGDEVPPRLVPDARVLQGQPSLPDRPRTAANLASVLEPNGL